MESQSRNDLPVLGHSLLIHRLCVNCCGYDMIVKGKFNPFRSVVVYFCWFNPVTMI